MPATKDTTSDAAAAIADAVRQRRLAAQNDPSVSAGDRVADASGADAAMWLLGQMRREQQQTPNRVVGLGAELSPEAAAVTSVGKP
jgi:hypothetical protein